MGASIQRVVQGIPVSVMTQTDGLNWAQASAALQPSQNRTPPTFLSSCSADSTSSMPAKGSRLRPKPTHCVGGMAEGSEGTSRVGALVRMAAHGLERPGRSSGYKATVC